MSIEKFEHSRSNRLIVLLLVAFAAPATCCQAEETVVPTEQVALFNGTDLTGFTSWLKATKLEDPAGVFSVVNGTIHMKGGEHRGYLATKREYRDYHFSAEFKWGKQTDGGKYVRNSGVLIHGTGAHGGAGGVWMPSIEVQLAQGCEGDLIVIRGVDDAGQPIKTNLSSHTRVGDDGRTRWQPGGKPTPYSGRQFWWSQHDPTFRELLDTRGANDLASPIGKWTRVECLCRRDTLQVKINGTTVNAAYDVHPTAGHILLQNEGHEVYFRNVTIGPLPPAEE